MLSILGHQQCAIISISHQQYENDSESDPSYSSLSNTSNKTSSIDIPSSLELGKTFLSYFFHKYMVQNCKYKGGVLGKHEQGMPPFPNSSKAQMTKIGLGIDGQEKKNGIPSSLLNNAIW